CTCNLVLDSGVDSRVYPTANEEIINFPEGAMSTPDAQEKKVPQFSSFTMRPATAPAELYL
ncbi:hypothetical protein C7D73_30170, partial [Klebsiella pneumoniae]